MHLLRLVCPELVQECPFKVGPSVYAPGWDTAGPPLRASPQGGGEEAAFSEVAVLVVSGQLVKVAEVFLGVSHPVKGIQVEVLDVPLLRFVFQPF